MKIYEEDYKLVKQMRRKQRKGHPKWEKSKKLRFILWGCSIITSIIIGIYGFFTLGGLLGSFFGGIGTFVIASIPAAIYTIAVAEECENFIGRNINQVIILDNDMIKHGYKFERNKGKQYTIDGLKYNKIQKIVYNKYHERIDIYGNRTQIDYKNYETGEVLGSRGIKGKKSRKRIYLHYKGCEDMLEELLKHTNIKPEIIDYPEE